MSKMFEKMVLGKAYVFNDEYINDLLNNPVEVKKIWTVDEIKQYLKKNDRFVVNSLLKMYTLQTEDEQNEGSTTEHNNVGFNAFDAKILTSIAKQCIENKYITLKQVNIVYDKIKKYSGQITRIANGEFN